ncbi:MAG: M50 family metallopeptidase [Polyangiales bacterium]
MFVLLAILMLGSLMAIHEGGHFLLARLFKMRVIKYSIGFGPVLWSKKPKGSETTYQIALLPFLAYVQIAGMNPHEEIEADDKGSYGNASWLGRFLTIVAGPLANYLCAVVAFFFLVLALGRSDVDGRKVGFVDQKGSAYAAHVQPNDEVKSVAGREVKDWNDMRNELQAHKGQEIDVVVQRGAESVTLKVKPAADSGRIGIGPKEIRRSVGVGEAAKQAVIEPPKMAVAMVVGLARVVTLKEKAELRGPVGIVNEAAGQMKKGWEFGVEFFVILSIYICVFNLIPFPALDGGRLAFLLYEFVARRRPDAKVEARVHMIGLLALLTIFIPVFFFEVFQSIAKLFVKG